MSGISLYELNCDVERYSFLSPEKKGSLKVYKRDFILDWNEITSEYLNVGIGDVPHFASQYVFAKALTTGRTAYREEMQTMYLDIIEGVSLLIKCGDLPKSV